ncbi:MAG: hypothetical protein B0W54_23160 [Cellvibrio sp. 79]|nr:MAG: hypothetical protein B0W54_23160 [Cellvibrio sp. 79]
MTLSNNILGPRFNKGDITTFIFDESELTLRLPVIPYNKNTVDDVSPLKDYRNADTRGWDTNDQERPCNQLASQIWCYEDAKTLDNVAECQLYLGLVEVTEDQRKANTLLSYADFEELMIEWHHYSFGERHSEINAQNPEWPAKLNRYHGRSVPKENLNWFVVQLSLSSESKPVQLVMIPVNNRFVLMAFIEIKSLHYAGRTNPYSDEQLKQFERDLFDDFLSHIKIEYSPEIIATIQSLKNKTPA